MTTAIIIVLALRLLVPLTIFRWRITGAIASMLVDAIDVVIVFGLATLLHEPTDFGDGYQRFDKWLDMYYLTFEVGISLTWPNKLARITSVALFLFRFTGIAAFELTGEQYRLLIFYFPNLFENFFLYYIIVSRFWPNLVPQKLSQLLLVLTLLYIPKFGQEWVLHYQQFHPVQWMGETFFGIESN